MRSRNMDITNHSPGACKSDLQIRGFTLIELMIVLCLFAIVLSIASSRVAKAMTRYQITGATMDVLAALREARSAAVERNKPIVFEVDKANRTYQAFIDDGTGSADSEPDGIPDNAGNHQLDIGEETISSGALPQGVTFSSVDFGGNDSFCFNTRGFPLNQSNALISGFVELSNTAGSTHKISLIASGHTRAE